jgi:hypothetical protein
MRASEFIARDKRAVHNESVRWTSVTKEIRSVRFRGVQPYSKPQSGRFNGRPVSESTLCKACR